MQGSIFHSHTNLCDGSTDVDSMLKTAIAKGFKVYGFSGHSPLPFESKWNMTEDEKKDYLSQIEKAKEKYADQIEILVSMEMDFIPGLCSPHKYAGDWDYKLGGIHFLGEIRGDGPLDFDHSPKRFEKILNESYRGSGMRMVRDYYARVRAMMLNGIDILAHIDLIRKFNTGNRFFDPNADWYHFEIKQTLDVAKYTDTIIEVNSRGKYKGNTDDFYPSVNVLKEMKQRGNLIHLSCDCHHPDEIGKGYQEATDLVKELGFKEFCLLNQKGRYLEAIA